MNRTVIVFTFPPKYHETDQTPQSVGLQKLKASEEIMAFNRAPSNPQKAQYELVKQAIVMWNGKPVGIGDGSVDIIFENIEPEVRTLIMAAYQKISSPSGSDGGLFLATETLQIG